MSHYKYLDEHLEAFWLNVRGRTLEEDWAAGIVSAHGDKGYGYRSDWEQAGIPFEHGMAIYLLTYTDTLGNTPKHESCQWVIDNYDRFKQFLPAV